MSARRLLAATAAMLLAAVALRAVTPDLSWPGASDPDPRWRVDALEPETLLLGAVAGLAWLVWAWGALGLLLTALSALPGAGGALARAATRRVLPAGARHAAALALGVGLAAGGPLGAAAAAAPVPPPADVAVGTAPLDAPHVPAAPPGGTTGPVPDWPGPAPAPPGPAGPTGATAHAPPGPDRAPAAHEPPGPDPAPAEHVVRPGDCLWEIAEADLRDRADREPLDGEVASAVRAWWSTNAAVVGPDPDLLLPGQVLRPPAPPQAVPDENRSPR